MKSSADIRKEKESHLREIEKSHADALSDTLGAEEMYAGPFSDAFDDQSSLTEKQRVEIINRHYENEYEKEEEEYNEKIRNAEESEEEFERALKVDEKIRQIVKKVEMDYRETLSLYRSIFRGGSFSSRYASAGDLTFRISDHSMPIGGGFSEEMRGRHGCADFSLVVSENDFTLEQCLGKDTRSEDVADVATGDQAVTEFLGLLYAALDSEIEEN